MKKWFVLFTIFCSVNFSAIAQDDMDFDDDMDMMEFENDEALDISGDFSKKGKQVSRADRMKLYREKLEQRNEQMMRKKIEQVRFKQEMLMMKQLKTSMDNSLKALDSIQ